MCLDPCTFIVRVLCIYVYLSDYFFCKINLYSKMTDITYFNVQSVVQSYKEDEMGGSLLY